MKFVKSLSFLALLLGCSLYSYWLTNKDFQWIVPYMDDRFPAAIRESQNLEDVVEKPMRVFKREVVASSILIRTHEGLKTFSMGQFPVKTQSAQGENLICLEYPYMLLTFSGEGAAINGRKPQVMVSAPCKVDSKNKDYMTNVPLPFGELERRPAENQEYKMDDTDSPVDVRVQNVVGGSWPKSWQLEAVEFHRDPNYQLTDKVIITSEELRQQLGEPIYVK